MNNNLPEKRHGDHVQRGATQPPTIRSPAGPPVRRPAPPPVHEARELGFVEDHDREYWWAELGDKVKAQIADKAGPTIEWWAYRHSRERDRAYAVVLGPKALVVTTPQRNNTGGLVQRVQQFRFVPGSLKYAPVQQRPSRAGYGSGSGGGGSPGPSTTSPSPRLAITTDLRGFLGNLPPEAQQRMQSPFVAGDPILSSDYFYHGSAEDLSVWCYLAGRETVMFLSGRKVAAAGAPPHAASWDLICRQAKVATG